MTVTGWRAARRQPAGAALHRRAHAAPLANLVAAGLGEPEVAVPAGDDPDLYPVRSEDLVSEPARELGRITRILGLAYEPAMSEGYGNQEGIPDRELAWKGRALQPISTARIATCERELSATQIRILERIGGTALESLGYGLRTGGRARLPLTFFPRLAWNLSVLAARLPRHRIVNEFCGRSLCLTWDPVSGADAPGIPLNTARAARTWALAYPLRLA
jgi:hypothetical protein